MSTTPNHIMTETAVDRAIKVYIGAVEDGECLRYFRKQARVSQADVAAYAGVSTSTVSRTEHGKRVMRPRERAAFARALGVSLAALGISTVSANGNGKAVAR